MLAKRDMIDRPTVTDEQGQHRMAEQYRQGDLLIVRVQRVPSRAVAQQSAIILTGETTGHAHRLVGGEIRVLGATATMYLVCAAQAQVVHEEHQTITLPPGLYQVRRQREYNPEAVQPVRD